MTLVDVQRTTDSKKNVAFEYALVFVRRSIFKPWGIVPILQKA